jgi:hypothetical protein
MRTDGRTDMMQNMTQLTGFYGGIWGSDLNLRRREIVRLCFTTSVLVNSTINYFVEMQESKM